MQFAPGPFLPGTQADVAVDPGNYDFSDDAILLAQEMDSNIEGWDDVIARLTALASDPLSDLLDGSIDGVLLDLAIATDFTALPDLDSVATAYGMADTQVTIATSFAPVQAWTDPPAPFVPPGDVLNISTPTIPAGAFTPGNYLPASSGGSGEPQVQLLNTTRVGQVNFVVGDSFNVLATGGKPGQIVTVDGVFNGAELGISTIGTLDGTGSLSDQGIMSPQTEGVWQENWYFDGALVSNINFLVTPGNTL